MRAKGSIGPHDNKLIFEDQYCMDCAREIGPYDLSGASLVGAKVTATIWIDNREYKTEKTVKELNAIHRGARRYRCSEDSADSKPSR